MSPRRSATLKMENVLLALLDQKPMHGYELHQELRNNKGIPLVWNIKLSMLYAVLEKLEENGYLSTQIVEGETYPRRKCFHITDSGKDILQNWLITPVHRIRDFRQEFLGKLIISRRYSRQYALDLIHKQKAACEAWLSELKMSIQAHNQENIDEWLVYSFRIKQIEGMIEWLKDCEDEFPQPDFSDPTNKNH